MEASQREEAAVIAIPEGALPRCRPPPPGVEWLGCREEEWKAWGPAIATKSKVETRSENYISKLAHATYFSRKNTNPTWLKDVCRWDIGGWRGER